MPATPLFDRFATLIKESSPDRLVSKTKIDERLLLKQEGELAVYYAPFDWINRDARIVLVGITPGATQMYNALAEAHRQLNAGTEAEAALREAKRTGAFSGPLRENLVAMLDYFGVQKWLGLSSTRQLFGVSASLLHTTSVIRFPTFAAGENFNGSPAILRTPFLRDLVEEYFFTEMRQLKHSIIVPLGDKVGEVIDWLVDRAAPDRIRVLSGLPHPSPQNIERIQYLIERRSRERLSKKTNPAKLDAVRARLFASVAALT